MAQANDTKASKQGFVGESMDADGKLLSRNEVYSPLVAYEQTEVAPSSYMMSQTSTPKSLRESSLITFLHNVSYAYHRHTAKAADPKNNGSRPTARSDVESKIRQRAVTLIGGSSTSSLIKNRKARKASRRRKRKAWNEVEVTLKYQGCEYNSLPSRIDSLRYLRQLNQRWNKYISSALKLDETSVEVSNIAATFMAQRKHLELVGAHLRIATCTQRRSWRGRYGVLVGETRNTWHIATLALNSMQLVKTKIADVSEPTATKKTVETLVVPKKGSCLILVVGTPTSTEDATLHDASESYFDLISISKRSICITLDPATS
eukprot:scaffold11809_cov128-Cylindrotheca_fusiformis.AAC.1